MTLLARRIATETVGVEPQSGIDGQGAPAYGPSQNIQARARKGVEVARDAEGTAIRADLMLLIAPDESPIPAKEDRLTFDGDTYIVTHVDTPKRFNGNVAHYRVQARDE